MPVRGKGNCSVALSHCLQYKFGIVFPFVLKLLSLDPIVLCYQLFLADEVLIEDSCSVFCLDY